jgi:hypothetical protein
LLFSFYFPPSHVSVVKRQKASNTSKDFLISLISEKEEKEKLEEELRQKKRN